MILCYNLLLIHIYTALVGFVDKIIMTHFGSLGGVVIAILIGIAIYKTFFSFTSYIFSVLYKFIVWMMSWIFSVSGAKKKRVYKSRSSSSLSSSPSPGPAARRAKSSQPQQPTE